MDRITRFRVSNLPRITKLSRRTPSIKSKVQPLVEKENVPCSTDIDTPLADALPGTLPDSAVLNEEVGEKEKLPSITPVNTFRPDTPPRSPLKSNASNQLMMQVSDPNDEPIKQTNLSSLNEMPSMPTSNEPIHSVQEVDESHFNVKNWIRQLTSKEKQLLKRTTISLVIIAAIIGIVVPLIYLYAIPAFQSNSASQDNNAFVCSGSTCIGQETPYRSSDVTALFLLNSNEDDQTGYIAAFPISSNAITYGQNYLSSGLLSYLSPQQYLQTSYIDLTRKSFTVQLWLFISSFASSNDFGLFGQCDAYNVCLSISLRNGRAAASLDSMNPNSTMLIGSTVLTLSAFIHITVVYDATFSQLRIYVNGRIDAISTGMVSSYQGSSENLVTTIARSSSFGYSNSYFVGRLDHLTISGGTARSACQILNDASLIVYYPFSNTDSFNDYSVNLCHGIASRTSIISTGQVGQAISFSSSSSYFQAQCFPRMRNGDDAYSISMWINPTSNTGGSVLHLSALWSGNGTCYDLLGLTASGNIVLQWIMSATNVNRTQGPIIPTNTWTHIAVVYQFSKGIRLYVNRQLSGTSSNTASLNLYELGGAPLPWYMTFGNTSPLGSPAATNCLSSSSIVPGAFSGAIDEFRLYNRELDYQELCVLSNP